MKKRAAMIVNDLRISGISTVVMNCCDSLSRDRFDVSIISGGPVADLYRSRCENRCIHLIELPSRKLETVKYYLSLFQTLRRGNYDIVHVHGNSATISAELLLAKLARCKVRIAHSHTSAGKHIRLHRLLSPVFHRLYTHGFACSEAAGRWMFGDSDFHIIPNGFEIQRFRFHGEIREKMRRDLHLENALVVGHMGRFNDVKNQTFLIDLFEMLGAAEKNAVLLLVGTGGKLEQIKAKIERHPYRERIILYGETLEPEKLYAAMDVFVLPSKYEGLGMVLLEAQINGLPCIASDTVPEIVAVSEHQYFLSLHADPLVWVRLIQQCSTMKINREQFFLENQALFEPFDQKNAARLVESLYIRFLDDAV